MRCVLLGPPGSGKGTLSSYIISKYHIPHISTGDMFREHKQSGSDLGKRLAEYIDKGQLVPDEVVLDMVYERLRKADCVNGFLFDGFPRTSSQAEALQKYLQEEKQTLEAAVLLQAHDELIISRLCTRRVCSCGAVYNIIGKPPIKEGICDLCGKPLVHRRDDTEDVIKERLQVYRQSTAPLVDFYEKLGILLPINAAQSSQMVEEAFELGLAKLAL